VLRVITPNVITTANPLTAFEEFEEICEQIKKEKHNKILKKK